MLTLKKILGIILLILAALFSLAILASIPPTITRCSRKLADSNSGGLGYVLGSIFITGIAIFVIYLIIKLSLKLIKKKIVIDNSIDEIGS